MQKEKIIKLLTIQFESVISFCDNIDESIFNKPINEKWSIGKQIIHLNESASQLKKGLLVPKFLLRTCFGRSKKESRSYNDIKKLYLDNLNNGGKATGKYDVTKKKDAPKSIVLDAYKIQSLFLNNAIDKWIEVDLDNYRLPHPLLGRLTVREMLYFTIYHTEHHLNIIKA